jgi:hypothetical protein
MTDEHYVEFLRLSQQSLLDLNYPYSMVYGVGAFEDGIDWDVTPAPDKRLIMAQRLCMDKPRILLDALGRVGDGELLIYIDVDVLVVERFDDVERMPFDIGLTCRGSKVGQGTINAGMLMARNTSEAKTFLQTWINYMESDFESYCARYGLDAMGDQIFLNGLVDMALGKGAKKKNLTKELFGTRVHFFNQHDYNFLLTTKKQVENPPKAKALHIVGGKEIPDKTKKLAKMVKVAAWVKESRYA